MDLKQLNKELQSIYDHNKVPQKVVDECEKIKENVLKEINVRKVGNYKMSWLAMDIYMCFMVGDSVDSVIDNIDFLD